MRYICINKEDWDNILEQLLLSHTIFAPVKNEFGIDYELLNLSNIGHIIYNEPKPSTPLKNFFLPVRENVTSERNKVKPRIIMGVPACDIQGLSLIDEIYLDKDFNDKFYKDRRESTIIISADCFGMQEYCHCLSYGVSPWDDTLSDLAVMLIDSEIIIRVINQRGEELVKTFNTAYREADEETLSQIEKEHNKTESTIRAAYKDLPDYRRTGVIVEQAGPEIWKKYSSRCVSCGACSAICPTCTCFLLIDKEGFEKVKQNDTCQYPGFARVAGGEDPLRKLASRFRNRYMCKYVWKPKKFTSPACTGCGRCIEGCIGKINKNELFMELA